MIDKIANKMNAIGNITQTNELETADRIIAVPIELIIKNKDSFYSTKHSDDIAESIKLNGQLEPGIAVATKEGKYKLISGHTRFEALKKIGSKTMQLVIKDYQSLLSDNDTLEELALIDANMQRVKTVVEQSNESVRKMELLMQLGHSKTTSREIVANDLNVSVKTVQRHEQINKLSDDVKNDILVGNITPTEAIKSKNVSIKKNEYDLQLKRVDQIYETIVRSMTNEEALKILVDKLNKYILKGD